jgi:lipopolysaccharide/colanic/teichoic acid biosynthesis glycosyltransferase
MLDLFAASLIIILLAPVLCIVAAAVVSTSPGPAFYRGDRVGLRGKTFKILKFRTMVVDAEQKGGYSTALNDRRLTRLGRFLRRWKLDELPQLFNVMVGDMSLVGPRPQVSFYTNKYSDTERQILWIRPGITDLASLYFVDMDSVLGDSNVDQRYETLIEPVKNQLRLRYVREASLWLDVKILLQTVFRIAKIPIDCGLHLPSGSYEA